MNSQAAAFKAALERIAEAKPCDDEYAAAKAVVRYQRIAREALRLHSVAVMPSRRPRQFTGVPGLPVF